MRVDEMPAGRECDAKTKTCIECGRTYSKGKREGYRDWNGRKYCSILCKNRHFNRNKGRNMKKWEQVICQYCGKAFYARKIYLDRGQMKYCSIGCSGLASRKHEVKEFNNKPFYFHELSGYYVADDGQRMNIAVWEFYNGKVPKGYVVHHKDEDKGNNEIDNLELLEWGEHTRQHNICRAALKAMGVNEV